MRYKISPITSKKIISLKIYGNKNHSVDNVSNLENTNFNCLSFYSGDDLKYAFEIDVDDRRIILVVSIVPAASTIFLP